jgi:hypothetical protein
MESKEFFSLFPEFRFEEKIEKPLELNLHANSVVSMNALNTVIAKGFLFSCPRVLSCAQFSPAA